MLKRPPILSFALAKPHPDAVRTIRIALEGHGLRIPAELDVAMHVRDELEVGLAPCRLLYVDDPLLLLEATIFHRAAALMIPQPVVIATNHHQSEVLVRHDELSIEAGVDDPVRSLHCRIVLAIETVAKRAGLPAIAGLQ